MAVPSYCSGYSVALTLRNRYGIMRASGCRVQYTAFSPGIVN